MYQYDYVEFGYVDEGYTTFTYTRTPIVKNGIQRLSYSVDLMEALLWQHNNAVKLNALSRAKNAWYQENNGDFWTAWVRDVFDMRTANLFGLRVWSIILDLPLNFAVPINTSKSFGFGAFNANFNRRGFALDSGNSATVDLEDARLLLRLRYLQLICYPSIPEINRILKTVFSDRGGGYALDSLDMGYVTYVFGFTPGSTLASLLFQYDVLPRPAGVGSRILIEGAKKFGFGQYNANFNSVGFNP